MGLTSELSLQELSVVEREAPPAQPQAAKEPASAEPAKEPASAEAANDQQELNPRVGRLLSGRYRLLERMAAGGMGVVYRAEREGLGRIVAVKFLLAEFARSKRHLSNFEREAKAMSRLSHPNCTPIIDFGVDGAPYLVMDFVSGSTLQEVLSRGPIPWERAARITQQVLAGVGHAHENRIVHRDIKPANIMLTDAVGLGDHVRILDFGLAKLRKSNAGHEVSMPNVAVGTPQYMAPEQWRAQPVGPHTDIYAVGVMLYQMLLGVRPFEASEPVDLMRSHTLEPPPSFASQKPKQSIPPALEAVVMRALEKAPEDRFASAQDFLDALAEVLAAAAHGQVAAAAKPAAEAARGPRPRKQKSPPAPVAQTPGGPIVPAALGAGGRLQTGWPDVSVYSRRSLSGRLAWWGLSAAAVVMASLPTGTLRSVPVEDAVRLVVDTLERAWTPGEFGLPSDRRRGAPGSASGAGASEDTAATDGDEAAAPGQDALATRAGARQAPDGDLPPLDAPGGDLPAPEALDNDVKPEVDVVSTGALADNPVEQDLANQQVQDCGDGADCEATQAKPAVGPDVTGQAAPEMDDQVPPPVAPEGSAIAPPTPADSKDPQTTRAESEERTPEPTALAEQPQDDGSVPAAAATAAELAARTEAQNLTDAAETTRRRAGPAIKRSASLRRRLAAIERMIASGRDERALKALQRLRSESPRDAHMAYLIGKIYYGRGWLTDAFQRYREAMRLDRRYAERGDVIEHLVQGLGQDATRVLATRVLLNDVGPPALRHLRRAAKKGRTAKARARAEALHRRITHRD